MLNILPGIVGLGILILIHELGHFIAARLCGIRVLTFSVGLGKTIFQRQAKSGTIFRLALIPFGGYVKMAGETEFREALEKKASTFPQVPGSFYSAASWKRIVVAAAGPAINILCGLLLLIILGAIGYEVPSARVVPVDNTSPAWIAGIRAGDTIVEINGTRTDSFNDVGNAIASSNGETLVIQASRAGELLNFSVQPRTSPEGVRLIGVYQFQEAVITQLGPEAELDGYLEGDRIVSINGAEVHNAFHARSLSLEALPYAVQVERDGQLVELKALSPLDSQTLFTPERINIAPRGLGQALGYAFERAGSLLTQTVQAIGSLFSGAKLADTVSGPLRISSIIGESTVAAISGPADDGVRIVLELFALINLALAFGNLLPLPVLDGGQILLSLFEMLSRRPLKPSIVAGYTSVGSILMLGLLAFIVVNDILYFIN